MGFKCKESTIASGHGFVVHRLNFEDCKKKMERQGLSFVYYGGSRHCQASHGDGEQDGVAGWTFCRALPAAEETAREETEVAKPFQSICRMGMQWSVSQERCVTAYVGIKPYTTWDRYLHYWDTCSAGFTDTNLVGPAGQGWN